MSKICAYGFKTRPGFNPIFNVVKLHGFFFILQIFTGSKELFFNFKAVTFCVVKFKIEQALRVNFELSLISIQFTSLCKLKSFFFRKKHNYFLIGKGNRH